MTRCQPKRRLFKMENLKDLVLRFLDHADDGSDPRKADVPENFFAHVLHILQNDHKKLTPEAIDEIRVVHEAMKNGFGKLSNNAVIHTLSQKVPSTPTNAPDTGKE